MKVIVSAVLATFLLAMGSIANAQTSTINPAAPATQQDVQRLKSQQKVLGHQLKTLNGTVEGLKADALKAKVVQGKLTDQLGTVQSQVVDSNATVNKSLAQTQAEASTLKIGWIASCCIGSVALMLVTGGGVWFFAKSRREGQQKYEELQQRLKEVQDSQKLVYLSGDSVNGVIGLRRACQESIDRDPAAKNHDVIFTYRLVPNPEKGHLQGGDLEGCIAVFDLSNLQDKPLKRQFPLIHHGEITIRLEDMPKYAAHSLGLRESNPPALSSELRPKLLTGSNDVPIVGQNFGVPVSSLRSGNLNS